MQQYQRPSSWQKQLKWLALGLIDYEGLAGFIIFLLLLTALVVWLVYKFAALIVPALTIALGLIVAAFLPFQLWSWGTIEIRGRQRIERCLQRLRYLEQVYASKQHRRPLEQRLRESAQAIADRIYDQARSRKPGTTAQQRQRLRVMQRDLEHFRLTYGVVPDPDRWSRFVRLHLEWDWVRYLAARPRLTAILIFFLIVVMTTAVAAVLPRF